MTNEDIKKTILYILGSYLNTETLTQDVIINKVIVLSQPEVVDSLDIAYAICDLQSIVVIILENDGTIRGQLVDPMT